MAIDLHEGAPVSAAAPVVLRPSASRRALRALADDAARIDPTSSFRRPAGMLLFAADAVGMALAGAVVHHARLSLLAMIVTDALLLCAAGQYRSRLRLSVLDDLFPLLGRGLAAYLLVAAISRLVATGSIRDFSLAAAVGLALQVGSRTAALGAIRWARTTGRIQHRVLIVGTGLVATRLAESLRTDRTLGLHPVGFAADGPARDRWAGDLPHLGRVADLTTIVEQHRASAVIVAFNAQADWAMVESLRRSERRGCDLFLVPRLFEIYNYGQTDHIGGIPVVRVRRPRLNRTTWLLKRSLDVLLSALALVALSPLLVVAAIAVRWEGGPGVLFRQTRVGLDGREFELLKLRSMRPVDEGESATRWNIAADDRVGPVGRLLRRTSLDELPQLLNVLRGQMTLVGPRPERPHFVAQFMGEIPEYQHRHRVPAGLTGLAQVHGLRGDTSIADRARYDNFYIENWSLLLDLKILAATVREVVGAHGG